MGALTIISHGQDSDTAIERATALLVKRGFAPPRRIDAVGHTVLLTPKMITPVDMLADDASGNFAAAAGTLIYKGQYGKAALTALLDDAKNKDLDDDDFIGCFVVILSLHGELRVFTDRLGLYKFYRTGDGAVWSSSFLVCAALVEQPVFCPQGVYEFVFQGSTYGGTVIKDIEIVTPDSRHIITTGNTTQQPRPFPFTLEAEKRPLAEHVDRVAQSLCKLYGNLIQAFGSNIDTALSGGYDSRLTLALLRDQGLVPEVHVYGRDTDMDVIVAKAIAKGEGFTLLHDDKERLGDNSPQGVARAVEEQFWAFDGCPTDGIVGSGSDLATRKARAGKGGMALNGGGGEVFRNFFYLKGGNYRIRDVLWTFYSQFDPSVTTSVFSEKTYFAEMERKIGAIFPDAPDRLSRTDVEYIYPGFRGRFWTGRNTSLNNHIGPALTPFFEVSVVREALRVPLTYKNHGQFEAALITAIDPALAAYPSAYGHDFASPPPLKSRMTDWATYLRPPMLRRFTYRLKNNLSKGVLGGFYGDQYRRLYLPDGTPIMDHFFHTGTIQDSERMNRILTLEYLAKEMGVAAF